MKNACYQNQPVYNVMSTAVKGFDHFLSSHHEEAMRFARFLGNVLLASLIAFSLYNLMGIVQENETYREKVGPVDQLPVKKEAKVKRPKPLPAPVMMPLGESKI